MPPDVALQTCSVPSGLYLRQPNPTARTCTGSRQCMHMAGRTFSLAIRRVLSRRQ
jgi:hypothetical protein